MALTEPEYTTHLFAGKGETKKDSLAHDIYIFLRAGGKLDKKQINQANQAIVDEALDYLLKDEKLTNIEKARICASCKGLGKLGKSWLSNDEASKGKLKAHLLSDREEVSSSPLKAPQAPQAPGAYSGSMKDSSSIGKEEVAPEGGTPLERLVRSGGSQGPAGGRGGMGR